MLNVYVGLFDPILGLYVINMYCEPKDIISLNSSDLLKLIFDSKTFIYQSAMWSSYMYKDTIFLFC